MGDKIAQMKADTAAYSTSTGRSTAMTSYRGQAKKAKTQAELDAEAKAKAAQVKVSAEEIARKKAEADAEYQRLMDEQAKKGKKLSAIDIAMGRR